jgi:hypothetical protein
MFGQLLRLRDWKEKLAVGWLTHAPPARQHFLCLKEFLLPRLAVCQNSDKRSWDREMRCLWRGEASLDLKLN